MVKLPDGWETEEDKTMPDNTRKFVALRTWHADGFGQTKKRIKIQERKFRNSENEYRVYSTGLSMGIQNRTFDSWSDAMNHSKKLMRWINTGVRKAFIGREV